MTPSQATDAFARFKRSKENLPVAFIMVLLLDVALLWISVNSPEDACLAGILMGMISIFGFVWMGVKEPKKILVSVTVIFLILSPVFAVLYTDALYSVQYPDTLDPDEYVISEVSVEPYVGDATTRSFNFTAFAPGNATWVSANLTILSGMDLTDVLVERDMERMNWTGGTMFYSEVELDPGLYIFMVKVYENGSIVNGTDRFFFFGPQNMEKKDAIMDFIPLSFVRIFLQIGGLTYILAGMYWWTRIARDRKREALTVRKDDEGSVKCPICERNIPYGTETCPYCGAELEYPDFSADDDSGKESAEDSTEAEGESAESTPEDTGNSE